MVHIIDLFIMIYWGQLTFFLILPDSAFEHNIKEFNKMTLALHIKLSFGLSVLNVLGN